ncbi:hypothetical protein I4U23_010444 [Adineta vaga]|nr:hypothetical protein I4U23_010444 [Adineta vaga]
MFKEFVYKLFSNKCQLKTLQLDISSDCSDGTLHQCLSPNSCLSELIEYQHPFYCLTLRHLYIRLNQTRFLENLIEHTPNLEQIVVEFSCSLGSFASWKSNIEALKQSKTNWFNKIPKLRLFSLKSFMEDDLDFIYLKWLLNNVNYIETLRLHIEQDNLNESTCQNIWKSWIDANFIHKYCLPDIIPNLIDFTFYICKECQLSSNEMKNIKNSFKIHPLFIEHQWTNVECLFDSIMSCQHLFCSSNSSINYSNIFNWTGCNDLWYNKHPSIAFLLDKSVQLSFKIPYTKIHKDVCDNDKFDLVVSLSVLSRMRKNKIIANPFRNVTKIQFGTPCNQQYVRTEKSNKLDEIRARVLAHLISMTVQLKYLIIEKFEWLLHIIQYAFTDVRMNALRTVQHVEFHCHSINKNVASMGNQLVRIVSLWMPYLQTLRICRPDDFPWTSHNSYLHSSARLKRLKSSETSKSIARHVIVFRHDLSQLVKSLNELTYLDISGKITGEIVEPYRQMAQTLFPHSRVDVEILRFHHPHRSIEFPSGIPEFVHIRNSWDLAGIPAFPAYSGIANKCYGIPEIMHIRNSWDLAGIPAFPAHSCLFRMCMNSGIPLLCFMATSTWLCGDAV